MSESSVPLSWCPVHGRGAKVQRNAGLGSSITWWECTQCCEAAPNAPTAASEEHDAYWVDDATLAVLREAGVKVHEGKDSRGLYRTGFTPSEFRLATALLAAREDAQRYRALSCAIGDERIWVYENGFREDEYIVGSLGLEALCWRLQGEQSAATAEPR